jgi:hypothetical protein
MRGLFALGALLLCVLNGGCAVYDKEVHNRGGYLDYLADEHWLKADSKKMRALRALAIEVSLARIASVSSKTDDDRQLLAIRIGSTTKRGEYVFACAFKGNPIGSGNPYEDPCFFYDSLMVDYTTALFDLAMLALPREDGRKLIDAVGGDIINPLNVGAVIDSLINIGRDAVKYGRVAGGLYRDTQELEVQVWLASPDVDQRLIAEPYRVTADKIAALRAIYSRHNDDMLAWSGAIADLRGQGLEPIPHERFIFELAGILRYQCDLITKEAGASTACKSGLPETFAATEPAAIRTGMKKPSSYFASISRSKNNIAQGRPRPVLSALRLSALARPANGAQAVVLPTPRPEPRS